MTVEHARASSPRSSDLASPHFRLAAHSCRPRSTELGGAPPRLPQLFAAAQLLPLRSGSALRSRSALRTSQPHSVLFAAAQLFVAASHNWATYTLLEVQMVVVSRARGDVRGAIVSANEIYNEAQAVTTSPPLIFPPLLISLAPSLLKFALMHYCVTVRVRVSCILSE